MCLLVNAYINVIFRYRHSWNAKKLANPKLVQPQAELEFEVPHESGDESDSDQEEDCSSPLNHPYNLPYHSTHAANNNSSFVVSPGEEQISFLLSHPFSVCWLRTTECSVLMI